MADIPQVLFVCTHNAGRSQMAAALLDHAAGLLNATTGPFDRVNYLGSRAGARIFPRRRLAGKLDRVTMALERRLRAETGARLGSGIHYPVRWDPFFKDFMTLADIYHYPTQHFDFHQRQLTLGQACAETPTSRGPGLADSPGPAA